MDLFQDITGLEITDQLARVTAYLQGRYEEHEIYLKLGPDGIVAMNPGRLDKSHKVPNADVLQDAFDRFLSKDFNLSCPTPGGSQNTVIMTGTSGSGKTTVLAQLLGGLLRTQDRDRGDPSPNPVNSTVTTSERRLWETIVLMEAFGNARTVNNADSSRMGKLFEIHLSQNPNEPAVIEGFKIRPLMLETNRLAQLFQPQSQPQTCQGEGSFHILYYLLAAGHPAIPADLCTKLFPDQGLHEDRLTGYRRVCSAMEVLAGMNASVIKDTWDALAAIVLLLGSPDSSWAHPLTNNALELLDFDGGVEKVRQRLEKEGVRPLALAKAIYRNVFDFWTGRYKPITKSPSGQVQVVKLVDICGFEDLETNGLFQLLVNDLNDKIHHTFLKTVLGTAAKHENHVPLGGSLLDKDSEMDRFLAFLEPLAPTKNSVNNIDRKLHSISFKSNVFSVAGQGEARRLAVTHTSGAGVQYQHRTFPSDNQEDRLQSFLNACKVLQAFNTGPKRNPVKVISATSTAIADCMAIKEALTGATVLFVKCIKASPDMSPWKFDPAFAQAQVQALSIVPTIEFVRAFGMEHFETKVAFVKRFGPLILPMEMRTEGNQWRPSTFYDDAVDRMVTELGVIDGKPWTDSLAKQGACVYFKTELLDRLRELVIAEDEKRRAESLRQSIEGENDTSIAGIPPEPVDSLPTAGGAQSHPSIVATRSWWGPLLTGAPAEEDLTVETMLYRFIEPLVTALGTCDDVGDSIEIQQLLQYGIEYFFATTYNDATPVFVTLQASYDLVVHDPAQQRRQRLCLNAIRHSLRDKFVNRWSTAAITNAEQEAYWHGMIECLDGLQFVR